MTDSLPKARYREHLERLHRDMLEALAALGEPVQWQKLHPFRTEGHWENTNEHDAKWWRDNAKGWQVRALYTQPAQPLSEYQVRKLVVDYWGGVPPAILLTAEVEFVRAIEAAHGITGDKP